jgi:hypothetical protein
MRFAGTAQPEQARALAMLPHCVGGVGGLWNWIRRLKLRAFIRAPHVGSGSWLCENVVVRRADRIDLPSDRYYRREDSEGLSISVNQRKIILLVFEFSAFSHSLDQNQQ